jgi:iduronate 2-sulfatase
LADALAQSIARHGTEDVSSDTKSRAEYHAESHADASLQLEKSDKVPPSYFKRGSSVSDKELSKLQEEHLNAAMRAVKTEAVPNAVPPPQPGNRPFSLGVRSDGRMNVLFVVADDYRPQSAVYGQDTPTPNIARLAIRGVTFDRAYAQITVCNPSRTSFLTGRAPDVLQIWNFERSVQGPIVTMPEYFRHHGYNVLGTGKVWHWEPGPGYDSKIAPFWPDNHLFQKLMRRDRLILKTMNRTISPFDGMFETFDFDFVDAVFAKRACRLIDLLAVGRAENGESLAIPNLKGPFPSILDTRPPFFLAVGFHLPHEPYLIPDASWREFDDSKDRRLRGRIAVRPYGMPPYAGGDMYSEELENLKRFQAFGEDQLAGYQYIDKSTARGNIEISGKTFGPMSDSITGESPLERYHRDAPFPDLMRSEIYRGYATGVSYMDKQLGKVLDRLRDTGLEESTVIVFFSDHGYDLGERGQWGKRNLFEVSNQPVRSSSFSALYRVHCLFFSSCVERCARSAHIRRPALS